METTSLYFDLLDEAQYKSLSDFLSSRLFSFDAEDIDESTVVYVDTDFDSLDSILPEICDIANVESFNVFKEDYEAFTQFAV